MQPSMVIGNILFPVSDLPSKFTFGGDLSQTAVELSDGSDYLSIVGVKWVDLAWSATMYATTADGSPIARAKKMEAQFRQAQPLTFTWTAPGIHERIDGTMTTWHWNPVADYVEYDITIHRSTDGGLMTGGVPRPPSATRRRSQALTTLSTLAPQVGPQTTAAIQNARGHGGV